VACKASVDVGVVLVVAHAQTIKTQTLDQRGVLRDLPNIERAIGGLQARIRFTQR